MKKFFILYVDFKKIMSICFLSYIAGEKIGKRKTNHNTQMKFVSS